MKRFILFIAVHFFVFFEALSTPQIPDALIIGIDTIYLQCFPLEELKIIEPLHKFNGGQSVISTACWRGYIATWQIIDSILVLKEAQKIDSAGTKINISKYFESNGYNPKTKNGYVIADWYSDTLKSSEFVGYGLAYKGEKFYVNTDFLKETEKRAELIFENGKLIENNIIPIEDYKIGDILSLMVYTYTKKFPVKSIIKENNGKKVRIEILYGTDDEQIKEEIEKEINPNNFWVNPRHCTKIE